MADKGKGLTHSNLCHNCNAGHIYQLLALFARPGSTTMRVSYAPCAEPQTE
jgi:hypothetical protein